MDDAKLDEIIGRIECRLERIEDMLQRVVETQQQSPFADRLAAYARSTRGELRGGR